MEIAFTAPVSGPMLAHLVLRHMPLATAVCDATLRLRYANPRAEQLLTSTTALTLQRERLHVRSTVERQKFREAITRACAEGSAGTFTTSCITMADASGTLTVMVTSLPDLEQPGAAARESLALLTLAPSAHSGPPLTGVLAETFRLTPAESRLALLLCVGGRLPAIARRLGIAHSTVRTQLKNIFAKTGTRSQSELLGLLRTIESSLPTAARTPRRHAQAICPAKAGTALVQETVPERALASAIVGSAGSADASATATRSPS